MPLILKPKMLMENYLESVGKLFRYYREMGRKAMEQLTEEQLHYQPDPESNSIAAIVKHLHGNMLSRWTDFLTTDGEKNWRDREGEFQDTLTTREDIFQTWNAGWDTLFKALDPLQADDLSRIAYIRNEGHTVLEAINRQLAHYCSHVGQIIFLAKHLRGADWQSLSIPKGGTEAYNQEKFDRGKGRRHFV